MPTNFYCIVQYLASCFHPSVPDGMVGMKLDVVVQVKPLQQVQAVSSFVRVNRVPFPCEPPANLLRTSTYLPT